MYGQCEWPIIYEFLYPQASSFKLEPISLHLNTHIVSSIERGTAAKFSKYYIEIAYFR